MAVSVLVRDSLCHIVLQITVNVLLPELSQAITLAIRNQTFTLYFEPEGGTTCFTFGLLVSFGYFEDFEAFSDGEPDIVTLEGDSFAALLPILESVELVRLKQASLLDALDDPVPLEHVPPKVLLLGHILRDGRQLVSEALMELADLASVLLDQGPHIILILARWQVKGHWCPANSRHSLNED